MDAPIRDGEVRTLHHGRIKLYVCRVISDDKFYALYFVDAVLPGIKSPSRKMWYCCCREGTWAFLLQRKIWLKNRFRLSSTAALALMLSVTGKVDLWWSLVQVFSTSWNLFGFFAHPLSALCTPPHILGELWFTSLQFDQANLLWCTTWCLTVWMDGHGGTEAE